jgi:EAL domain-containing protein (putative c-di-GMP-specific phosphodiesterase class I)
MLKRLIVIAALSIPTTMVAYQPLLFLSVHHASLQHAKFTLEHYRQEIEHHIDLSRRIIINTQSETKLCDQKNLWRLEYQSSIIRIFGYTDLNTKKICWSEGFVTKRQKQNITYLQQYSLSETESLSLVKVDNINALVFTKTISNQTWFTVFEPIDLIDNYCIHCYRVIWQTKETNLFNHHQHDLYRLNANLYNMRATFEFNLDSIQKRYQASLKPFVIGVLIGLNLLLFIGLIRQHFNSNKPECILKKAIHKKQIYPHYQPIVDTTTGQVTAVEVLARWDFNNYIVSPSEFIFIAESTGLIDPLLLSLFEQVEEQRQQYKDIFREIPFCFNVAPTQLERPQFVKELLQACRDIHSTHLPIAIEVTERQPFKDMDKAKQVLQMFTELDINIKLDDTGTGYGSFAYIQNLGLKTIKIDKMFIDTIATNDLKRTILDGIIEFGHTAQLHMVAEGVENEEQVEYLINHNITHHQGFYYSRPLTLDGLAAYIEDLSKSE